MRRFLLNSGTALFLLLCAGALLAQEVTAQEQSFEAWREAFIEKAIAKGHEETAIRNMLGGITPDPKVLERDAHQPEFVRPLWQYLDSAVSKQRINDGRKAMVRAQGILAGLQLNTGVPVEVIVAIWGLESAYGKIQGDFDVVRSLATLAHDGRRRKWAEGELLAVATMLLQGVPRTDLKGAWAGAMGQTQFIPSTFLAYAVDGDGDGDKDIWNSEADALASTANYLSRHGWKPGVEWGQEVVLVDGFPVELAEDEVLSIGSWQVRGAELASGESWPDEQMGEAARLLLPAGGSGPALLVTGNFRVFKRYNNSTAYALAVGLLGDALLGREGLKASWPKQALPLRRAEVRELQTLLHDLGHDPGGVDGMAGPNTRRALRAYQQQVGLLPDGYVSQQALQNLLASARQPE